MSLPYIRLNKRNGVVLFVSYVGMLLVASVGYFILQNESLVLISGGIGAVLMLIKTLSISPSKGFWLR